MTFAISPGKPDLELQFFFSFEILEAERKVSTQPSFTLTDFDTDIDNTT